MRLPRLQAMHPRRNPLLLRALGPVLHERRAELGLTQETIAQRAGLDRAFISLLESARKQPSVSVLWKLAAALRLHPATLVSRIDRRYRDGAGEGDMAESPESRDPLTGLLNRAGFIDAASARLAGEEGERPHRLAFIDLDNFKAVNEAFGMPAGDRVLRDVTRWLQQEFAAGSAILGRWEGDRFAVLHDPRDADDLPERIAQTPLRSISPAAATLAGRLGMSVGFCEARGTQPLTELIAFANEALQEARRAGGSRSHRFDEALRERLDRRRDIERDLAAALDQRTIGVWYQPILAEGGARLHSLEALLRWDHPRQGRIAPEEVIFAAAAIGMAERLLRHILEEICHGLHRWNAAAAFLPGVPIAINVSPREVSRLPLDGIVLDTLRREGIAPQRLRLEITEEVALDTAATRARLDALVAAGVSIAIDDFGAGYSSLALLRNRYVQQVKIDRSFVSGLPDSPENQLLVGAIVCIGRSLDIEVVAEGVETSGELEALGALGCLLVQGYHLARPAPLTDVMAWALRHAA